MTTISLLVAVPEAQAVIELKLNAGTSSVDIQDGDPADLCALANCVAFAGALDGWDVNITIATSKTAANTPELLDINSLNITARGSQSLILELSDDGFSPGPLGFFVRGGGALGNAVLSVKGYIGTAKFDTSTQIGSTLNFNATLFSASNSPVALAPVSPFSLTEVVTVEPANGDSSTAAVSGTVFDVDINPVPVDPDALQIGYAANMNVGDSVVNLTNTGNADGFEPGGNLCANVYVFSEDQQLVSCCTCPLSPNHLKTLSVRNDLISNTLTPGVPVGVTIAVLGSTGTCNASSVTGLTLSGGLRTFGTTIHARPDGTYGATENAFLPAILSPGELVKLTSYCGFVQANGSGYGICKSCREGAAGAARQ